MEKSGQVPACRHCGADLTKDGATRQAAWEDSFTVWAGHAVIFGDQVEFVRDEVAESERIDKGYYEYRCMSCGFLVPEIFDL